MLFKSFPKLFAKFLALSALAFLAVQNSVANPLHAPLFKASAVDNVPDTLEVFCLYVNFQDESAGGRTDDPTTTGLGTFGSAGTTPNDPEKKNVYKLDPNGSLRSYQYYLEKHFDFARNYFTKVSNGRVVVAKPRIFPPPGSDGKVTPYQLPLTMKAYNPAEKDPKQKTSDFTEERGQALMTFVYDAITQANKTDTSKNPFVIAKKESLADSANHRKHRCYLLFHAGISRLVDGGQLGSLGANTPNDFTDWFVTKNDFKALDSATETGKIGGRPDLEKRASAKGIKLRTGDTLSEVMMLSEAASQDKINWGINGILINQLARQMGMPDMFDVVKGISQLGNFDLMDFAGYNTMNGFLPVYPSAWVRSYMGWEEPVTARPNDMSQFNQSNGNAAFSEYSVYTPTALQSGAHITTVKVPLNDREYLLVENRQRAAKEDSITIYFSKKSDVGDNAFSKSDSMRVPFTKADSIFIDSICDDKGKNCKERYPDFSGIITGASSYDLGLPASGLLVWHVNEWFISQFLKNGAVNAYLGDTLKSQFKGVELVEADGSLSIGKEFKDQLGQPAFDYGSGSDMLPHLFRKRKNPPKDTTWSSTVDTLTTIGPYGAANTNAWNDGRTHIRLQALLPSNPVFEKRISSFSGDSIYSFRDSVLNLRVYWPDNKTVTQASGSKWPIRLDTATSAQSINVIKNPAGGNLLVSLSDRGYAQAYTPAGVAAIGPIDTLRSHFGYDSVKTLLPSGRTKDTSATLINSLVAKMGRLLGSATFGDSMLVVLTKDSLSFISLRASSLVAKSKDSSASKVSVPVTAVAGPIVAGDRAWVITGEKGKNVHAKSFASDGKLLDDVNLPEGYFQSLAAFPSSITSAVQLIKPMNIAIAGAGGQIVIVDVAQKKVTTILNPFLDKAPSQDESFTVTASDFDRDGGADLFLLGSRGSATLTHLDKLPQANVFNGFPQRFPRSVHFIDSVQLPIDTTKPDKKEYRVFDFDSEDPTGPALADLNQDGHPDIIFSGTNSVFAIDYHGAFLKGWPFLLEKNQNVGFTYGSKRHPESAIQSMPLVLTLNGHATVLIGSPDGLILAVDSAGQKLKSSSFDPTQKGSMGILSVDASDWPLTMGGITLDSNDNPFIHLVAADLGGDGNLELIAQSGTGSMNVWTLNKSAAPKGLSWTMPGGNGARQNYLDVSDWSVAQAGSGVEAIEEFFLFPSPVRGPTATVNLRIMADAQKARLRIYDLAGLVVKDEAWENLPSGLQAYNHVLDLSHLGADVYSALIEVTFPGGKQKKWVRFGVIR